MNVILKAALIFVGVAGSGVAYGIARDWSPTLTGIAIGSGIVLATVALTQASAGVRLALHERGAAHYAQQAAPRPYIINTSQPALPASSSVPETMPSLEVVDAWVEEVEV